MKKTLIITLEFPPIIGGIASYVDQLASSLPAEKIVVLAPIHRDQKSFDEKRPYKIIRKKLYFPGFIWPRWWRLYRQAKKIIREEGIEEVHVHHVLPVGYAALLLRIFRNIPYVIFSHGTDIAVLADRKWKRRLASKVVNRSLRVMVNSESLSRRLLNVFPEFASKTSILYPCPEPKFLQSPLSSRLETLREQYALAGKSVILSVSRLADGKGFPHLIRIMPEILARHPHVVWFIVGDGPKKNEIIADIQKNNLQNIVRFIGEIPHDNLWEYYYLADIFVLLTHPDDEGHEEGLGLVFLEAAAAGLPVIAGRSGGVAEAVLHGQTGYVFDIHTEEEKIIESTVRLLQNPAEAKQLGRTGQDRIRRDFRWDAQLQKVAEWL